MTPNEMRQVSSFERNLEIGQRVEIRWTNSFRYYSATAFISKINAKSVRAKLEHEVPTGLSSNYEAGREITAPLFMDFKKWSANNCVCPIGGYTPES